MDVGGRESDDVTPLARYTNGYAYVPPTDPTIRVGIHSSPNFFAMADPGSIHQRPHLCINTTQPQSWSVGPAPIGNALCASHAYDVNHSTTPQLGSIVNLAQAGQMQFTTIPQSGTIYASSYAERITKGGSIYLSPYAEQFAKGESVVPNSYASPLSDRIINACDSRLFKYSEPVKLEGAGFRFGADAALYADGVNPGISLRSDYLNSPANYPQHALPLVLEGHQRLSSVMDFGAQRLVSSLSGWDNFETMPDGSVRIKSTALGLEPASVYTYRPEVLASGDIQKNTGIDRWVLYEQDRVLSAHISSISISTPIKPNTHELIYPASYTWRRRSTFKRFYFGSWTGKTVPALAQTWKKDSSPMLSRRGRAALLLALARCRQRHRIAPKNEFSRNEPVISHDRTSWSLCSAPARSQIEDSRLAA